jgi:hypothetical protein
MDFKVKNYLIQPRDIILLLKSLTAKDYIGVVFVCALIYAGIHGTPVSPASFFFILIAIIFLFWNIDSRYAAFFGVFCFFNAFIFALLYSINILLLGAAAAETAVILGLYFFCLGILKQQIEYASRKIK